jgi:hypothetical protein
MADLLEGNVYLLDTEYSHADQIESRILVGFTLPVTEVFGES